MGKTSFRPAQTAFSRVFLIPGRARPDHRPLYQFNMKAGAVSQGFGDVERIEIPDSSEFGKFVEVGVIRGAVERATLSLMSRYAADLKSEILKLARSGCALDIQIIFGACTDPTNSNVFTKKIILEDAILTSYDLEELGALGSDEQGKVDESVEVAARDLYEVVQMSYAERASDLASLEVLDVTVFDTPSCGDCLQESGGCDAIYSVGKAAGAGTRADTIVSLDGGVSFFAHPINTLPDTDDPSGIAGLGVNLIVVSNDDNALHYVAKSELVSGGTATFTRVATGFVLGGEPNAIDSAGGKAFIVGDGGYIYSTEDPGTGVTLLDAGTASADDYNDVSALNDEFAVAVGQNGSIAVTSNGSIWSGITTSPIGIGTHFTSVLAASKDVWLLGASNGRLYYTVDGGASFSESAFPGSGSGSVQDIAQATASVLYLSHTTAGGVGRILRSTNGGFSWVVAPEGSGLLPKTARVNSLAACQHEGDFVVGVGLAEVGTDGYIVVGTA
jgi:hypothetical protein